MRKLSRIIAAATIAAPLFALQPASAHAPAFEIAAAQYVYQSGIEDFPGLAGYVNTPAGPVKVNDGPSMSIDDYPFGPITNRDAVPHTFSECTSACDTAVGVSGPTARFDLSIPSTATVAFVLKPGAVMGTGTYVFMCTIHKFMRGRITID